MPERKDMGKEEKSRKDNAGRVPIITLLRWERASERVIEKTEFRIVAQKVLQ